MTAQLKQEIATIVNELVASYKPEKIILFGSAARGEATEESDLDFLLVKKTNANYFDRVRAATKSLSTTRPLDVIIFTPTELDKAISEKRLFIRQVFKYGTTLYETTTQ